MPIDITTNTGKLRLKVGDYQDLPILPDAVYEQTLLDNDNNINRSAQTIAGYIAAILSQRTHEKMSFLEVWGAEAYNNYMDFIKKVLQNPAMAGVSPIPYAGTSTDKNPLIQFTEDWYACFAVKTQSEDMEEIAAYGSNYESV